VLSVNNAVASVQRQEELKRRFPPDRRLVSYTISPSEAPLAAEAGVSPVEHTRQFLVTSDTPDVLSLVQRAHPDLGRLGVFWHTQGSGKSYSMAFFAEKVRRVVPGNFTFVIMTDREDLDDQICRTCIGCSVADEQTPRASSGAVLQELLQQNHRCVFSLMHKFNQEVKEPYSERDDIIVISDEAHRTQGYTGASGHIAGKAP
jgi:type I restriction enzyme R subunit